MNERQVPLVTGRFSDVVSLNPRNAIWRDYEVQYHEYNIIRLLTGFRLLPINVAWFEQLHFI